MDETIRDTYIRMGFNGHFLVDTKSRVLYYTTVKATLIKFSYIGTFCSEGDRFMFNYLVDKHELYRQKYKVNV